MSNYDFSTLNPTDFEILACDLLNAYFKNHYAGSFQTFKAGKDKGIDILLSTPHNDYEVIGQVKHYVKSPYSKLIYDLKKTEKNKVFKLKPKRYIIITSVELSYNNKLEIKKIFEPYITCIDDIFGREDLNRLLRSYKHIEENHFKLWFSSTVILNKLLHYKFQGRRKEFTDKVLKRKLRLFVTTKNFYKAKLTLQKNKFLILTGEPGVGKSTLSEMLIYNYVKDNYQLNIIYDDIKEVEINLVDNNSKQLFYFDDFLGHTQEEINKSKSAENTLLKIISRIENLENKFLILNTRKFILTSFLEESERLRNFDLLRSESKIELATYSYPIKRKILENHINESNLKENHLEVLNSLAHKICSHHNFTPRLIEFFTSSKVLNFDRENYTQFIFDNLKNPKEIWSHAYNKQITNYERFLLNTLYSFNGETSIQILNIAYEGRLNYEVKNNNYVKPLDSFNEILKKLNDGFINISDTVTNFSDNNTIKYISYINHSLGDYLKYSIENNQSEIERILFSSKYLSQWYYFYKPFINKENELSKNNLQFFISNHLGYISESNTNNSIFKILIFIYYFNTNFDVELIKKLFLKITDWSFLNEKYNTHFYARKFIIYAKNNPELNDLVSKTNYKFFVNSILNENNLKDLIELYNIFKKHYNFNFDNIPSKSKSSFNEHVKLIFENEIDAKYNFLKSQNTEKDYHIEIIENIDNTYDFIHDNINEYYEYNYNFLKNQNWNQIAQNNHTDFLYNKKEFNKEQIDDYFISNDLFENYDYEADKNITLDELIRKNNLKKIKKNNNDKDDLPF